jgi:hypothetical protein
MGLTWKHDENNRKLSIPACRMNGNLVCYINLVHHLLAYHVAHHAENSGKQSPQGLPCIAHIEQGIGQGIGQGMAHHEQSRATGMAPHVT